MRLQEDSYQFYNYDITGRQKMSKFTVNVIKISKVYHHPNADRLDIVEIGDYNCIVQRDTFCTNDLAIYIPEFAILPKWILQRLGFWKEDGQIGTLAGKQGNRVKAIRLRGIFSQGIIFPVEYKKDVMETNAEPEYGKKSDIHVIILAECGADRLVEEGDDVAQVLGITKYEPVTPTSMNGEVFNAVGMTPRFDIDNIKKFPTVFTVGEQVTFTEKLHGCVAPSTLIMLPNGKEIAIEQIMEDDSITSVLSYDIVTAKFVTKQITSKFRRPNKEKKRWVKMIMENERTLPITEDHPVFSNDRNEYIKAKDIQPGEDIKSPLEQ